MSNLKQNNIGRQMRHMHMYMCLRVILPLLLLIVSMQTLLAKTLDDIITEQQEKTYNEILQLVDKKEMSGDEFATEFTNIYDDYGVAIENALIAAAKQKEINKKSKKKSEKSKEKEEDITIGDDEGKEVVIDYKKIQEKKERVNSDFKIRIMNRLDTKLRAPMIIMLQNKEVVDIDQKVKTMLNFGADKNSQLNIYTKKKDGKIHESKQPLDNVKTDPVNPVKVILSSSYSDEVKEKILLELMDPKMIYKNNDKLRPEDQVKTLKQTFSEVDLTTSIFNTILDKDQHAIFKLILDNYENLDLRFLKEVQNATTNRENGQYNAPVLEKILKKMQEIGDQKVTIKDKTVEGEVDTRISYTDLYMREYGKNENPFSADFVKDVKSGSKRYTISEKNKQRILEYAKMGNYRNLFLLQLSTIAYHQGTALDLIRYALNNTDTQKEMLKYDGDKLLFESKNSRLWNALMYSAFHKSTEEVQLLLANSKSALSITDAIKNNVLHLSFNLKQEWFTQPVVKGTPLKSIVEFVEYNPNYADADMADKKNEALLRAILTSPERKIDDKLIALKTKNHLGYTPVTMAAALGYYDTFEYLKKFLFDNDAWDSAEHDLSNENVHDVLSKAILKRSEAYANAKKSNIKEDNVEYLKQQILLPEEQRVRGKQDTLLEASAHYYNLMGKMIDNQKEGDQKIKQELLKIENKRKEQIELQERLAQISNSNSKTSKQVSKLVAEIKELARKIKSEHEQAMKSKNLCGKKGVKGKESTEDEMDSVSKHATKSYCSMFAEEGFLEGIMDALKIAEGPSVLNLLRTRAENFQQLMMLARIKQGLEEGIEQAQKIKLHEVNNGSMVDLFSKIKENILDKVGAQVQEVAKERKGEIARNLTNEEFRVADMFKKSKDYATKAVDENKLAEKFPIYQEANQDTKDFMFLIDWLVKESEEAYKLTPEIGDQPKNCYSTVSKVLDDVASVLYGNINDIVKKIVFLRGQQSQLGEKKIDANDFNEYQKEVVERFTKNDIANSIQKTLPDFKNSRIDNQKRWLLEILTKKGLDRVVQSAGKGKKFTVENMLTYLTKGGKGEVESRPNINRSMFNNRAIKRFFIDSIEDYLVKNKIREVTGLSDEEKERFFERALDRDDKRNPEYELTRLGVKGKRTDNEDDEDSDNEDKDMKEVKKKEEKKEESDKVFGGSSNKSDEKK
ncbi:MAG: hypothetical protein HQK49_07420 [Oligoflexia bacterium]|nr:hypothetical protein [Oligoflexia bacterium]